MSTNGILVKLAGPGVAGKSGEFLRSTNDRTILKRLFKLLPAEGAARAERRQTAWYRVTPDDLEAFGARSAHPWDIAHSALTRKMDATNTEVIAIEPDLEQGWTWAGARRDDENIETGGPINPGRDIYGECHQVSSSFSWHTNSEFTGLRTARTIADQSIRNIKIAHLDADVDFRHPMLKPLPNVLRPREFVSCKEGIVRMRPLFGSAHGIGTLGILAGGGAAQLLQEPGYTDIGGAQGATILPVQIADGIEHFTTSSVAQGIAYATAARVDVICMALGGLPSNLWADVVNAAYEAGVVVVCAAGNNFSGFPTSLIVYPARFSRVIAACGVRKDGRPYASLGGSLEGNSGPITKMDSAMAAFADDIPWLRYDGLDSRGMGTNVAAPQIAAAAALWLAVNPMAIRSWRTVEAVRFALFSSSRKTPSGDTASDRYIGQGVLDARGALDIPVQTRYAMTPADSASFDFLRMLSSDFGVTTADAVALEMYRLEITQLALNSRSAIEAVPDPDLAAAQIPYRHKRRFLEAIAEERTASHSLRLFLKQALGHTPEHRRAFIQPEGAENTDAWRTGVEMPRRVLHVPRPTQRRLRVFATDPGASEKMETSFINVATISVPWESLSPGPVGEYLEVVDVDPASNAAYRPVDLDDRHLLAQDGHAPSEGLPAFHQQMVYAVAMRTIRNFEIALGRRILWAERRAPHSENKEFTPAPDGGYVQRLRIYPHAMRERNAYYSPAKKALLFGYFDDANTVSEKTIFTCLSHDIIAHETTHAILDGLHRRFQESTNPDVLSFHEAISDIVAIFQHFTFPELVRFEIERVAGDLSEASALSDLAAQFGASLHNGKALRSAISNAAEGRSYAEECEPHERGAILVAAVFEAFLAIYRRRTRDLIRIATGGGSTAPARGALHPDLIARLAKTAVEIAQKVLTTCVRALDYMPPIDPSFGDYLRAIITADADSSFDDQSGYRVAFAEAFKRRGIYPRGIASVSPDSLLWHAPDGPVQSSRLNAFLHTLNLGAYTQSDRRQAFSLAKENARRFHGWLSSNLDLDMARSLGLDFRLQNGARTPFEVHSVRPARRTTGDGEQRTDIVAVITQRRWEAVDKDYPNDRRFVFRGGCTLLLDREYDSDPIRFAIARPIWNTERLERIREFMREGSYGQHSNAFDANDQRVEHFSVFHANLRPKSS